MFDLNLSKMKKSSWTAKCSYWGNVLKSFFFESFWNLFKILQKYVDRIDGLIKLEPVSLQIYWKFKFITKVNFEFKFPYSSPRIWLGIVLELSVQKCQLQKWSHEASAWKVFVFEVFLVRIFPHSDWIRRDTPFLFVFSPNAGKHGPENSQYRHFSRSEHPIRK